MISKSKKYHFDANDALNFLDYLKGLLLFNLSESYYLPPEIIEEFKKYIKTISNEDKIKFIDDFLFPALDKLISNICIADLISIILSDSSIREIIQESNNEEKFWSIIKPLLDVDKWTILETKEKCTRFILLYNLLEFPKFFELFSVKVDSLKIYMKYLPNETRYVQRYFINFISKSINICQWRYIISEIIFEFEEEVMNKYLYNNESEYLTLLYYKEIITNKNIYKVLFNFGLDSNSKLIIKNDKRKAESRIILIFQLLFKVIMDKSRIFSDLGLDFICSIIKNINDDITIKYFENFIINIINKINICIKNYMKLKYMNKKYGDNFLKYLKIINIICLNFNIKKYIDIYLIYNLQKLLYFILNKPISNFEIQMNSLILVQLIQLLPLLINKIYMEEYKDININYNPNLFIKYGPIKDDANMSEIHYLDREVTLIPCETSSDSENHEYNKYDGDDHLVYNHGDNNLILQKYFHIFIKILVYFQNNFDHLCSLYNFQEPTMINYIIEFIKVDGLKIYSYSLIHNELLNIIQNSIRDYSIMSSWKIELTIKIMIDMINIVDIKLSTSLQFLNLINEWFYKIIFYNQGNNYFKLYCISGPNIILSCCNAINIIINNIYINHIHYCNIFSNLINDIIISCLNYRHSKIVLKSTKVYHDDTIEVLLNITEILIKRPQINEFITLKSSILDYMEPFILNNISSTGVKLIYILLANIILSIDNIDMNKIEYIVELVNKYEVPDIIRDSFETFYNIYTMRCKWLEREIHILKPEDLKYGNSFYFNEDHSVIDNDISLEKLIQHFTYCSLECSGD
ncbi:uncharacterized protein CMU_006880 [Cryptosporidium muris RN66]|uniref:Uncharacterized protein n=1 Tax=Cryptosporidium muris (strain RN66) TaxID=441375 RepID=B6AHS0_CRYMR|nr:uncharacterized protein CMU_006880 [Cryptosporidium muris RN66]EEA07765.1 hypothetical protein, conserved [Cryptosporidium muris RN66]|eukprot:XP_002142114.1 hypothetical protein [Cryptosporidium muris RN66]